MISGEHPCNICKRTMECYECACHSFARQYECNNDDCFLNYDGTCLLYFYENCGAYIGEGAKDGK